MKQKQFISMALVLVLLAMLCGTPAYGAEIQASTQITRSTVTIEKRNDGGFSIFFSVRATGSMETIGASKVEVQRFNGSIWVEEYTFTPSNTPGLQAENQIYHSLTLSYSPEYAGKDYRAVATVYVKDASESSTKVLTSTTTTA